MTRAEQGYGGVVLLSGEAGVGKTRLITELADRVARRGVLVLCGSSSGHDSLLPYGPVIEALEGHLARLSSDERQGLAARYPELVRLLPSLSPGAQFPADLADSGDQSRLFPTIVCLLSELAWKRSLLLVLRDLHSADAATIHLLQYLARLAIQRHWLVIGSYREEDLRPERELRRMLRTMSTTRLCRAIELRCLARQDCDQMITALLPGGTVGEEILEYVYAVSLGNPLFIEELVRAMCERDELVLNAGSWQLVSIPESIPRQVRNLVESSMQHFDDQGQRVLALAATAAPQFTCHDLRSAATSLMPAISENVLLDVLDQALDAHIIAEKDDGYEFRQPLFRAALREQLSHHRRVQFQAALAGSPVDGMLPHGRGLTHDNGHGTSRRMGPPPAPQDVAHAHPHALSQLASIYGDLVDRLDRLHLFAESCQARGKLASALIGAAKYDRALYVLEEASQFYRATGDEDGLARIEALMELARSQRDEFEQS
jgi:predicted ATPase